MSEYNYYLTYTENFRKYNFDSTIPFNTVPDSCLESLITELKNGTKQGVFSVDGKIIGKWKRYR